jgi:hypothetical protein
MTEMPGAVSGFPLSSSSPIANSLADFTHDMARSRAFRWGEDGIAGVSDSHGFQNIAFAFWNEKE